jgi:outer membrane receptor for ferrienterochelin and colicin
LHIAHRGLSTMILLCLSGFSRADDLAALSLEELMTMEVVSTPQFSGRIADLPASVSILTANDIRTYGWRTLAEALRSLRGFNVTYDRAYSYAGVRGLSAPGDYKPRLSVLIDGISATENIYDSVLIGGEFPLDIDLIERIEVVRGPSSSIAGGDAMGGVINIITRNGASLHGAEAAVSAGSGDATSGRASVGGMSDSGVDYLLSASGYNAKGEELKFPEMAPLGNGIVTDRDDERRRQLFAKARYEDWHASLIYGERRKTVPTGSYGTVFNDPSHRENDTEALAEIGHQAWLEAATSLSTRIFTGFYSYDGTFPYLADDPAYYHNRDTARGKWWGSEVRLQSNARKGHHLMLGAEFIDNYQQDQRNSDVGFGCIGYSSDPCLDARHDSTKWGVYAQDEILLAAQTRLTVGLRLDHTVDNDSRWNPRLGLVQHTRQAGTFKLLYATAYREPSAYENYYVLGTSPDGTHLKDEYLHSMEGIWEYALDARTQLTVVAYQSQVEHVVAPDNDGVYRNLPTITSRGTEFELYRVGPGGGTLRTSYALQFPELSNQRLANAPQHLLKINWSQPIFATAWSAGVEIQASSKRRTEMDTTLGGYGITNLNLIYAPQQQPWDLAIGIYNLFDRQYEDPIATDNYMNPSVIRDGITQNGRTWRIKLAYKY